MGHRKPTNLNVHTPLMLNTNLEMENELPALHLFDTQNWKSQYPVVHIQLVWVTFVIIKQDGCVCFEWF